MKHLSLALLFLALITSCSKDDTDSSKIHRVATIKHSSNSGPSLAFEYYPDGKLKQFERTGNDYGIYEYYADSIVFTCYNLSASNGNINELKYTTTYVLNSDGLAISSVTVYPNNTRSLGSYEYDSNGFLTKAIEGGIETNYTISNENITYTADYYEGNILTSESFECFSDKLNNTNSNLFNCFDYTKTGADFLGKRGKNLLKESLFTHRDGYSYTYEYTYTFDSKGRVVKMTLSSGNYFDITYTE